MIIDYSIVGVLCSIIGSYFMSSSKLNPKKELTIWILYIFGDIILLIYGLLLLSFSLTILYIVFIAIAIKGVFKNIKKIKS